MRIFLISLNVASVIVLNHSSSVSGLNKKSDLPELSGEDHEYELVVLPQQSENGYSSSDDKHDKDEISQQISLPDNNTAQENTPNLMSLSTLRKSLAEGWNDSLIGQSAPPLKLAGFRNYLRKNRFAIAAILSYAILECMAQQIDPTTYQRNKRLLFQSNVPHYLVFDVVRSCGNKIIRRPDLTKERVVNLLATLSSFLLLGPAYESAFWNAITILNLRGFDNARFWFKVMTEPSSSSSSSESSVNETKPSDES